MRKAWNEGRSVVLLVGSLVLFLGSARAGGRLETMSQEAPQLRMVWYDGHRLYPGTHEGVARQVASIFGPLELEMHWQEAMESNARLDERTILLRIVLMPSNPSGPGWRLDGHVLGAVPPGGGRVRSIFVFYNELVKEVSMGMSDPAMRNPPLKLLEKALGRVVAHEMIHAVAPSVRHARRGLMRPSVGSLFLVDNDVVVPNTLKQSLVAGAMSILVRSRLDQKPVSPPSTDRRVSQP